MHKFNREMFNKRIEAKKELEKPQPPVQSLVGLRDRMDKIEKIIGINATTA